MEAPSIPIPTVNVGRRQQGRERGPNTLDDALDQVEATDDLAVFGAPSVKAGLHSVHQHSPRIHPGGDVIVELGALFARAAMYVAQAPIYK